MIIDVDYLVFIRLLRKYWDRYGSNKFFVKSFVFIFSH